MEASWCDRPAVMDGISGSVRSALIPIRRRAELNTLRRQGHRQLLFRLWTRYFRGYEMCGGASVRFGNNTSTQS